MNIGRQCGLDITIEWGPLNMALLRHYTTTVGRMTLRFWQLGTGLLEEGMEGEGLSYR